MSIPLSTLIEQADSAFELKDFQSAIQLYYQAHQPSQQDAEIAHSIGSCCYMTDEIESALKWLNYAVSLNDQDLYLHNSLADILSYND
ncbi:tetratricopeptide repeat protein [Pedobacter frigidisoli]|uniref:tetratricopeptide repeat protein n=1 Tax=Pedobacter frigidisoli TaxID=2530455 RepID=UPI002931167E|nr:tetratricopeptide repeat protein [Pedobacter frigidisoli]